MLKANEARELVERAINKEIEERRTRAIEKCEEIGKIIEEKANERYTNATVDCESDIRAYVIQELKDNGYGATYNDTTKTIVINW